MVECPPGAFGTVCLARGLSFTTTWNWFDEHIDFFELRRL